MNDELRRMLPDLSAYADGELAGEDARRVEAFLRAHPEARAIVDAYRATDADVAGVASTKSDAEWEALAARVDAAIERDDAPFAAPAPRRTRPPGVLGWFTPRRVAFSSAGTIAAALLVVALYPFRDELQPPLARDPGLGTFRAVDPAPSVGLESKEESAPAAESEGAERLQGLGYLEGVDGGEGGASDERAEPAENAAPEPVPVPPAPVPPPRAPAPAPRATDLRKVTTMSTRESEARSRSAFDGAAPSLPVPALPMPSGTAMRQEADADAAFDEATLLTMAENVEGRITSTADPVDLAALLAEEARIWQELARLDPARHCAQAIQRAERRVEIAPDAESRAALDGLRALCPDSGAQ